jgi:sugar/nucleoside kinase (ribokinase family)
MGDSRFDVCGIGNAIVDIIGRCDDAFLESHGAPKGHMQLCDAETMTRLYNAVGSTIEISGGSGANTMAGIASFGGKAAFIGKVGQDDFGGVFTHDIKTAGVTFETPASTSGTPTARSLVLVTPDGERTMNTFLGVSPELGSGEIDKAMIADSAVTYLEGYLYDKDEAKAAFAEAAGYAKAARRKVSLTLSDGFCVDRHRGSFLDLIKNDIDILFANESEITSLYETESFDDAAAKVGHDTALAVLTRSEKGSMIVANNEMIAVDAYPVTKVVDTTGAGDLYAAGFLYGYTQGLDHATSARLGGLAASEIISHIGARPETKLSDLAKSHGLI